MWFILTLLGLFELDDTGDADDLFANGEWCDCAGAGAGVGGGADSGDSGLIELGLFVDLVSFDICVGAWLFSFDLPCEQQHKMN